MNKWGWYHFIETIAGQDLLKIDAATKVGAWAAFTHMTYMIDFNTKKAQEQPK